MSKLKLLIAEDQPSVAILLKKIIEECFSDDFQIFLAKNGDDALDIHQKIKTDIIISDWVMPEMDGLELCKKIKIQRLHKKFTFFMLITGAADEKQMVNAFEVGIDDFISKPFSKEEIYARLISAKRIINLIKENEEERNKLSLLNKELEKLSKTDMLTEIPNKKYFVERIGEEWAKAKRKNIPLGIGMLDLDFFKKVNDTFGHIFGDYVLKKLAQVIKASIRKEDVVCRFGGEEFVIIAPDSDLQALEKVFVRIQDNIKKTDLMNKAILNFESEGIDFKGKDSWELTLSFGGAEKVSSDSSFMDLLQRADENLYEAKQTGRNKYILK